MKILVISDTHNYIINAIDILNKIKVDAVIHLGDVVEDCEDLRRSFPDIKFFNVAGNCDFGAMLSTEKVFEIGEKKFFITHGHIYGVNYNYVNLSYRAEELGADICLYGHTHKPLIAELGNIIIMNPGSISRPRGGNICTFGIIELLENDIIPSIWGIYNDEYKIMDL